LSNTGSRKLQKQTGLFKNRPKSVAKMSLMEGIVSLMVEPIQYFAKGGYDDVVPFS
jgi:hypothetical protein